MHSKPSSAYAGLRSFRLPADKPKGPRCSQVGLADGTQLELGSPVTLSGSLVQWLGPLEHAVQSAVRSCILQVPPPHCRQSGNQARLGVAHHAHEGPGGVAAPPRARCAKRPVCLHPAGVPLPADSSAARQLD